MTLLVLFFLVAIYLLVTTPFYILGKRRDVAHPWAAFVPLFGVAIVLFQSIGHSGWLSLMLLVPFGSLVFVFWTAFAVPPYHRRTRWWTLALLVPVVSLFGWWAYALTLLNEDEEFAFA